METRRYAMPFCFFAWPPEYAHPELRARLDPLVPGVRSALSRPPDCGCLAVTIDPDRDEAAAFWAVVEPALARLGFPPYEEPDVTWVGPEITRERLVD